MADFLFSVGTDLSQLTADLNRLRELAAGITLPTGLDRGINQANTSLRNLSTTAAGTSTAMRGATQGITAAGQAAEQAAVRTNKFLDQQKFVLRTMADLAKTRVGDLGVPQALQTFQRLAGVLQQIDQGLISNKKNLSTNEFKQMQLAATELTTAMRRLGTDGLANVRALNDEARNFEKLLSQRGNAEARDASTRARNAERVLADIAAEERAIQKAGQTAANAAAENDRRTQQSGKLQARALQDQEARATRAENQLRKLAAQQEKLGKLSFGAPAGTGKQLQEIEATMAKIGATGPITARALNQINAETKRLLDNKGVASVFNDLGTSMARAVKVGLEFTLIYGALRAAIAGVQELVQLDKQMTNIAATITDAGQRAKTLPLAFDLTREAMTTLGLSAEKAGGLVFELQKVFDGNAEMMRAAFIPALVLTANKEADQAETVRVLVGAYNLYGDTLQGAGTAQEKFTKLSDMLLKSSFLSVASVQDLSTALGSVAATGRQSGVSFSQLLGVLVVLSDSLRKSGQSGAGLNRTFEALLENAQHAANIFDVPFDADRGLKPFETLLEILEKINEEVQKSGGTPTQQLAQKISSAFPTIQSRQTILTLAGQVDKIREVAREAEGASAVTTTAFDQMQKSISAAAGSLFNEFLTGLAAVTSAIGGDAPGKFETLSGVIRGLAREVRDAAEWFERLARFINVGSGNVFDIFGVGSGDRERFNNEVEELRRRHFPGDVSAAGTISDRLRGDIAPFADSALGPFRPVNFANTLRIHQETAESPTQRLQRLVNDAVNEIFEESQRSDPTRALPDRLRDALEQQQKSEAALRQGRAAPGKLGKDEATQVAAVKALARDAAEDQKRLLAIKREIADFDARNFVENMKRNEELRFSTLAFRSEQRVKEIEAAPGALDDKFKARLDFETQAEIDEAEKRVKTQQDFADAVVSIMGIRDEKLRQFRIGQEREELESIKRQVDAFQQATDTELEAQGRALQLRIQQSISTQRMLAGDSGVSPASEIETVQKVLNKEFGLDKLQVDLEAAAASFGKFGEEAVEASLRARFLRKDFTDMLPESLIPELERILKTVARVTAEMKRQEAVLALMASGFDKATASMIALRNEADQVRIGNIERATEELKKYNESAERARDATTELAKQTARFEGDAVGFFFASLKKSADEMGGFFKGLEELSTDTARNMQSAFSDLFFDIFTNQAMGAGEVFKNFMNSMLRSVSNFLANQLVQQLLSLFFPGQGAQQLSGPSGFNLSSILGSVKELFNGTGVSGTNVAQGPEQLGGPGFEGGAAASLPTSSGGGGLSGLLAALPAIGAGASALGGMLGPQGSALSRFGSIAAALGGAATLFKSFQSGNVLSGGAGVASILGGVLGATGVGGKTGQLAGTALSSLGLLAGGPGSTLAGGLMVGNTLINAYRSFSDPNANQGTGIGGVAGTALGGAIGAYLGGDTQSTVTGAAIGGAIGELIGSIFGKEGLSHAAREDREVAATIDVAIAFQKSIQSATSAVDLFNKLVEGTIDSDGRGDDTPIVTRVGGVDIRELNPQQLLDRVTNDPSSVTADISAGVDPARLADAETQLADTIRALVTALNAVKTGLARFGEIALNLTKDSGTLLDLEEIKGPFEAMREEIKDIDTDLAEALKNVSGLPTNLDDILALVNKRYQVELDFLREVNDAVKAIRESIADQRTDIELQFATPAEKVKIIQRQIDGVLSSLRSATDPREIASLTQEGQGLVRDLLGQSDSLTNDFGLTGPGIKQTALNLLNQLEELSTGRLGNLSEAAREGDSEFVDFLLASAQKMGLSLDLTSVQMNMLAVNAARAAEALIRLGIAPAGAPLGFAQGGIVPGSGRGDSVRAMLEPGEMVVPRSMVEMMRAAGVQQFAAGGPVYPSLRDRMFGNNNPQPYGDFVGGLSGAQQASSVAQLLIQLASTFTKFLPFGTDTVTGWAGRKSNLLPTYNTESLLDLINPNSDRGLGIGWGAIRDVATSLFGAPDRFDAINRARPLSASDQWWDNMGAQTSAPSPFLPFISGGAPAFGGFGSDPGFESQFMPNYSRPSMATSASSYFQQAFGDLMVSGSGAAYPYGSTPTPFGGGSRLVGGVSDPYAFNIPWSASPLTAQALGFAPWQMYDGAIMDRALATGSMFGSRPGSFSATYGYQSPYATSQYQAWGGWMGPGVTGQGYNPYQYVPGNTTLYGGQAYRPTGTSFTGTISASRYAEGGFVSGSGTGDTIPALLTPGEFVVPVGVAQANKTLLEGLSKTGIGNPSSLTAAGARSTMTRAAGTALGSLSKGIGGTIVKAGDSAAGQLGDAIGPLGDAFIRATAMAFGSIVNSMGSLRLGGGSFGVGVSGAGYAEGGFIAGSPSGNGFDNVPIWASAGEFVVPRYAAQANGRALEQLRTTGSLPGGQSVIFNLQFHISGVTNPASIVEEVEDKIEESVRRGRLGLAIAERTKRRV